MLLFGMLHLFLCLHLQAVDGCCGSFEAHGSVAVCRESEGMRPRMSAARGLTNALSVSGHVAGTRLCDADSTGQTSTHGRLRSLVVGIVLRGTLATVLAKDLLGEVLCFALLAICVGDVNCVFCC